MSKDGAGPLAEMLRRLRQARGLSQQDLAAAADVAVNTIWAAEKGQLRPRPRTLRRVAAALGVPVEQLLRGETAPVAGGEDPLNRYLLARAGGRLAPAELARLHRLIERLVEAELAEPRSEYRTREGAGAYGRRKVAEKPRRYR
jgi:transcriptional regulator with XRE-family HTH domain